MYVKCRHCGGIIDPDTLVCLMCAREYRIIRIVSEKRLIHAQNNSRLNDASGFASGPRLPKGGQI